MHRFSVYKRGNRFYVQFWNPHLGRYSTGKSTGATSRREATLIALQWAEYGIPTADSKRSVTDLLEAETLLSMVRKTPITDEDATGIVGILEERGLISVETTSHATGERLLSFLSDFWNYETSAYIKEKEAFGHRIGKRHCYDMRILVQRYWNEYFPQDMSLADLRREDLRSFSVYLAGKQLAPKTRNNILMAGTVAIKWAYENEIITSNPSQGLRKFAGSSRKRGVLSDEEVKKLFAMEWPDNRMKLANKLAATTGLRAGEIAALRVCDLGEDKLHIRHSWSEHDRLKSTKTNKERTVPVMAPLLRELRELAHKNPHDHTETAFVFWSSRHSDRPTSIRLFAEALQTMLVRMVLEGADLDDTEKMKSAQDTWQKRGVVFHSWRHYYSARLADHIDQRSVMLATGHKTQAVFDAYSAHGTDEMLEAVRTASDRVFSFIAS